MDGWERRAWMGESSGEGKRVGNGGGEYGSNRDYMKGSMDTYYSRSFLKYAQIWRQSKWNAQRKGEIEPQMDISCHQVKLPILELGYN